MKCNFCSGYRTYQSFVGHCEFRFCILFVRLAPDRSHIVHRELVSAPPRFVVTGNNNYKKNIKNQCSVQRAY